MLEFKAFIERGNVVDLAIGVVIGSAFGKIVSSVVDDLLMPIFGVIIGGIDFSNLSIKIGDSVIKYGSFINNVINFFIIAICVFILVKFINRITKKKEQVEKVEEEPKKSDEVLLLEQIRDELKKTNKSKNKSKGKQFKLEKEDYNIGLRFFAYKKALDTITILRKLRPKK